MNIVYCGSFNPITMAHLLMAQTTLNLLPADRIIFVPTSSLYSKPGLLEDDERLNIIRLALEDNKKFVCSDIEMRFARENKRQLKTYETLKLLKNKYDNLALLIGADNFHFLDSWYKAEQLVQEYKIIVYPRVGEKNDYRSLSLYQKYPASFIFLDTTLTSNISASLVRENYRQGISNRYLVSDKVNDYILKKEIRF
ncbi:MAG TPA: nicotinate (nicotinamide) nucleotide adenylyltransferase [Erysipelotrichaceae bacterium]|nr:nicotinate (nicotinamide) nucleotide adenylyltransferase [Erysipelotrichaceae bacterium]